MSAWMCRSIKPLGRMSCLLLIAGSLAGCSAFDAFTKKDKAAQGDDAIAQEHREKSFKELDQPIKVHLTYAQWREEIGDMKGARESYQAVLDSQPKNVDAQLGMARVAYRTGQVEQAEQAFQHVLSTSGGNAKVLDELAQFYAEQDRWSESAALLRQAVQLEPEDANYHYHFGVALARSGDMRGAFDEFQAVMTEAESFYNLGHILYEQGNVPSAEQHLVRSLQLKPDLVQARNLLSEMHSEALQPVRNENNFRTVSGTAARPQQQHQPQIQPGPARPASAESDRFQLPAQSTTDSAAPYPSQGYQDPTPFGR